MERREIILYFIIACVVVYMLSKLYPFYQRYWASCTDGGCDKGKRYVDNLEVIAGGLSFDDAEKLANELRKPGPERNQPDLLDRAQYGLDKTLDDVYSLLNIRKNVIG